MIVREGGLDHPAVVALLEEHFAGMLDNSPPGTCHFLDLDALAAPAISFFSGWDGASLVACGALKEIDAAHGELKSMRVAAARMGTGAGRAMLDHIVAVARDRGYRRVSLETGTSSYFAPAQGLYERSGFVDCAAFADYAPSDANRYMTLGLDSELG